MFPKNTFGTSLLIDLFSHLIISIPFWQLHVDTVISVIKRLKIENFFWLQLTRVLHHWFRNMRRCRSISGYLRCVTIARKAIFNIVSCIHAVENSVFDTSKLNIKLLLSASYAHLTNWQTLNSSVIHFIQLESSKRIAELTLIRLLLQHHQHNDWKGVYIYKRYDC